MHLTVTEAASLAMPLRLMVKMVVSWSAATMSPTTVAVVEFDASHTLTDAALDADGVRDGHFAGVLVGPSFCSAGWKRTAMARSVTSST